ncbi:sulfur oxidation c-type cytochrome SoxA [compost metagenome]
MLAEGNPAELWEAAGEELWKKPAGPKNASLEQCDLGKGPGVTKGAYAELPRYFKDANKVMDLEQRLAYCRMTLQGLTKEEATKNPFSASGKPSDIERLVAYLTGESRGVKMNVQLNHPEEKRTYALGQKMFFYRGGAYDFACATCLRRPGDEALTSTGETTCNDTPRHWPSRPWPPCWQPAHTRKTARKPAPPRASPPPSATPT